MLTDRTSGRMPRGAKLRLAGTDPVWIRQKRLLRDALAADPGGSSPRPNPNDLHRRPKEPEPVSNDRTRDGPERCPPNQAARSGGGIVPDSPGVEMGNRFRTLELGRHIGQRLRFVRRLFGLSQQANAFVIEVVTRLADAQVSAGVTDQMLLIDCQCGTDTMQRQFPILRLIT
jgi:hypothetical protein